MLSTVRLQRLYRVSTSRGVVELQQERSNFFFAMALQPLGGLGRRIFRGFTITLFRHTTLGRAPLDEGPARRRDLYLTKHNTHKRQTSMPPVGFERTILVSERPQTHALDRTDTGIGNYPTLPTKNYISLMTRTEIVLETSVYSPFKHLTRLLAREYFIELQTLLTLNTQRSGKNIIK
jgi:hypothetical protein